jgi:hypothetical protein
VQGALDNLEAQLLLTCADGDDNQAGTVNGHHANSINIQDTPDGVAQLVSSNDAQGACDDDVHHAISKDTPNITGVDAFFTNIESAVLQLPAL